jgi:hypothetical protein
MRERRIVQLTYSPDPVDNHGKTAGTGCAQILDKAPEPLATAKVIRTFRPGCESEQHRYHLRIALTLQGIIQLSTGLCNAC